MGSTAANAWFRRRPGLNGRACIAPRRAALLVIAVCSSTIIAFSGEPVEAWLRQQHRVALFATLSQRRATATPRTASVKADKLGGLGPWLQQQGGLVSESLCLAGLGASSQARGLAVDDTVVEGEVLLAVPSKLWLSAKCLLPVELERRTAAEPWDVRLAAGLALLLNGTRLEQQEALRPYLRMLPPRDELEGSMPLLWNETALRAQEPWLAEYVGYRRQRLERVYTVQAWQQMQEMSREDLSYAHALVLSRTLGSDDTSLIVPLIDLANHAPQGGSLCSANCRLANVGPRGETDLSEADSSDVLIGLVALTTLEAGDEVLFEYGPYNNDDLFLQYGFRLEGNPYDAPAYATQELPWEFIAAGFLALAACLSLLNGLP
mmetsp:Transcript_19494/g.35358  ORF Transcript_19494/g.35358 Transcript_19494/m.35358 type:complete len:378 (+) Transcript_19494:63-1196(+)